MKLLSDQSKKPKIDSSMLDVVREKKSDLAHKLPKLKTQEILELDQILRLGTNYFEEIINDEGKIFKIRPLSIPETQKATNKGLIEIANTETLTKIWSNMKKKEKTILQTPADQINLVLYANEENAWLVMFSLRDFDEEIQSIINKNGERRAVDFVKKNFKDLNKIAKRIKRISGLTKNSRNAVESFQEDLSRAGSDLRDKSPSDKTQSNSQQSN